MSPSKGLRAIAFDADGVLFESVDVKTDAFRHLFASESPPVLKQIIDYHQRNGGISRFEKFKFIYREILQQPLSEERFDKLCNEFAAQVVDRVVAAPWVPGAFEFIKKHHQKYLLFVASATPDPEIKTIASKRSLSALFHEILGSPQPKAVLLKTLLSKYDLQPTDMVYVGDAQNDWHAARELGIPFIWRRLVEGSTLSGYVGPTISSLDELEETLALG